MGVTAGSKALWIYSFVISLELPCTDEGRISQREKLNVVRSASQGDSRPYVPHPKRVLLPPGYSVLCHQLFSCS
ncbi:hypothetical protein Y1Q_0017936 [Alligator mississippiensis]|uniref:Uncharacterized protein n=1 Tax=Alligator mississippiensis TaxID=8496 RepID=A0A151MXP3_ALLMI|nr:hypothetical protein Y1Q_0017936 [Alligator mississippiensis]